MDDLKLYSSCNEKQCLKKMLSNKKIINNNMLKDDLQFLNKKKS